MRRVLFIFLCLLALISAGVLVWSFLPTPQARQEIHFLPDLASRYGQNTAVLEYPSRLYLGQTGQAILWITPGNPDALASATDTLEQIVFQSRLDLPGVLALPSGMQFSNYDPASGVELAWKLIPIAPGSFEGVLKVYALKGDTSTMDITGELVFAIPIFISLHRILGLPLDVARFSAIFLLVLAGLGFILMISSRRRKPDRID